MSGHSSAWRTYVDHLREVAQLLVADPASRYGKSRAAPREKRRHDDYLTAGLCRGALVLTCSYLQGYFASALQEFLERIDESGVDVAELPRDLKSELCMRFPFPPHVKDERERAELIHRTYGVLWRDGTSLPPGTIRTGSLSDPSANPWPNSIASLMKLVDVDVYDTLRQTGGMPWVTGVKDGVKELVMSRNKIAHGDDTVQVTADDVRRLMHWATRMARAADVGLRLKLLALTGSDW